MRRIVLVFASILTLLVAINCQPTEAEQEKPVEAGRMSISTSQSVVRIKEPASQLAFTDTIKVDEIYFRVSEEGIFETAYIVTPERYLYQFPVESNHALLWTNPGETLTLGYSIYEWHGSTPVYKATSICW